MRVLVTGASAPLHAALVRKLRVDPDVEAVLTDDGVNLEHAREVHDLVHSQAYAGGIDVVVAAGPAEVIRQLLLACEQARVRRFVLRSTADVYTVSASEPNLLDEDSPLDLEADPTAADVTACVRIGTSAMSIAVLRLAEVLGVDADGQLRDYLSSRICMRPLGFDPMINVLSREDAIHALRLAVHGRAPGVFNIPGADTLPLSEIVRRWRRRDVPVPGPLLAPLYRLRMWAAGFEFRYDQHLSQFHFGGVLDGGRAAAELGYRPGHRLTWPLEPPPRALRSRSRAPRRRHGARSTPGSVAARGRAARARVRRRRSRR